MGEWGSACVKGYEGLEWVREYLSDRLRVDGNKTEGNNVVFNTTCDSVIH